LIWSFAAGAISRARVTQKQPFLTHAEGTQLRKFEMRFGLTHDVMTGPMHGPITPILRWLPYTDHQRWCTYKANKIRHLQ
ncbi:hypothetical protein, partial [Paraburkholderia sp. RL17-373-BIF-A]|uniref:hypothetical protein n=1 Tax=Paraburkholderia sp. RL17-373-BIF-A TaxID=3031629 RepID=UPI0038BACB48